VPSLGLPYYVQILGRFASQSAVRRKNIVIEDTDVRSAMHRLALESGESFFEEYRIATESNREENFFREVLLSCALADTDQSGFFTATKVLEPFGQIMGEAKIHAQIQRHLNEFISERRGEILIRRGIPRQYRYRFSDPLMQPYVIIKGILDKMLDDKVMRRPYSGSPRLPTVS
jgi:hypothetical protein